MKISEKQKRGGCDLVREVTGKTFDGQPFRAKIYQCRKRMTVDVTYHSGEKVTLVDNVRGTRTDKAISRLMYDVRRDYLDPFERPTQ